MDLKIVSVSRDTPGPGDDLLSVEEIARTFRVCQATIRNAIRFKHMKTTHIGRKIFVSRQDALDWRAAGGKTTLRQAQQAAA